MAHCATIHPPAAARQPKHRIASQVTDPNPLSQCLPLGFEINSERTHLLPFRLR